MFIVERVSKNTVQYPTCHISVSTWAFRVGRISRCVSRRRICKRPTSCILHMTDQASPCGHLQKHSWLPPSTRLTHGRSVSPKTLLPVGQSTTRLRVGRLMENCRRDKPEDGKWDGGLKSLVVRRAGSVMRELLNILYPRHVRVPNTPDGCQIETVAAAGLQVGNTPPALCF